MAQRAPLVHDRQDLDELVPRVKRRGVSSPRAPAEQSTATARTLGRIGLSMYHA